MTNTLALSSTDPSSFEPARGRVLTCPCCGIPHVDEDGGRCRGALDHDCQHCGARWRPFRYPTIGIGARYGGWIGTVSGRMFFPLDPRAEDIEIGDIAHGLSNLCRYTGQLRDFYSVAQHSVLVSLAAPPEHQFHALLHDAAEAYCADLNRIVKHSGRLEGYRQIEDGIARAIASRFGLPTVEPDCIKVADNRALATEYRDLLCGPYDPPWPRSDLVPFAERIVPWSPRRSKEEFLARFVALDRARART